MQYLEWLNQADHEPPCLHPVMIAVMNATFVAI